MPQGQDIRTLSEYVGKLRKLCKIPFYEATDEDKRNFKGILETILSSIQSANIQEIPEEAVKILEEIALNSNLKAGGGEYVPLVLSIGNTLNNEKILKRIVNESPNELLYYKTRAASLINDKSSLKKMIEIIINKKDFSCLSAAITEEKKIYEGFEEFLKENYKDYDKNEKVPCVGELYSLITGANQLAKNHDIGIAIGKCSAFPAYIFSFFRPVLLCEAHANKEKTTFEWCNCTTEQLEEKIKGKKIVILEAADVITEITEKTLQEAVEEIKKYSPKSLDLFLALYNRGEVPEVPKEINKVFYPKNLDYNFFYDGYLKIKKKLK